MKRYENKESDLKGLWAWPESEYETQVWRDLETPQRGKSKIVSEVLRIDWKWSIPVPKQSHLGKFWGKGSGLIQPFPSQRYAWDSVVLEENELTQIFLSPEILCSLSQWNCFLLIIPEG